MNSSWLASEDLAFAFNEVEEAASSSDTDAENHRAWHVVLGIPREASPSEIRAAYIDLMKLYHPSRIVGLGPKLVEVAEREAKRINIAYEEAKRERRSAYNVQLAARGPADDVLHFEAQQAPSS
jgi:DnaJ-class molecular chaperone